MKKCIYILFVLLAAFSCDNSYLPGESKEELVVEGWIENGHAPIVLVSSTLPVSSTPRSLTDITEHILRYAVVYIDHDGGREYLTARMSSKFAIQNYFTSPTLRGEAGKTYTLHVKWQDYNASATCTIPEPPKIDSSWFEKEFNDSSYVFKIRFSNDPAAGRLYQSFRRVGPADSSLFSAVNFTTLRGSQMAETVTEKFMSPYYNEQTRDMYFHPGDIVAVKLATIEEPMYTFWNKYANIYNTTGSTVLTAPTNLPGNVSGAIGYWAGYGIDMVQKTCQEIFE